ncbi:hypothetical protein BDW_03290 [Bdellovibrio bacteriovorus W]|nr:hypothetical protein BDW_03290 [Bdellovibrio bacteriovorus W]
MKNLTLGFAALLTVTTLTACNNGFSTLTSQGLESSLSVVKQKTAGQIILDDIETQLRTGSTTSSEGGVQKMSALSSALPFLSGGNITDIIAIATGALNQSGLQNSNDLNALIPVLMGGLSQGVGGLQLPSNQAGDLLSMIGSGSMESILTMLAGKGNLPVSGDPSKLLENLSGSLFKNLPVAGIGTGDLSGVAKQLIGSLTGGLALPQFGGLEGLFGGGALGTGKFNLNTLLQSISSGAMMGTGSIQIPGMNQNFLQSIISQIGAGSVIGIGKLPGQNTQIGLEALLEAFTSGSSLGLGELENRNLLKGGTVSGLLGLLTQGQTGALPSIGVTGSGQQSINLLLQLFLANLGR